MGNVDKDRGKNKSGDALRPSYARFYASKWRSGTLMLTLEEEGLYIRVSAYQMECGQPIPKDWKEGARLLCVQPLKYRKTVDALIAKGKLVSTPEGIICQRAIDEFKRASKGVDGDKSNPPTNPDTYPDTNPVCNPVSMGVEAKIDQQNQTDFPKRREEEEKKEDNHKPASVEQDAAGVLACLNGARFEMIETLAHWVSPYSPDRQTAKGWLESTCGIYGGETVKSAYAELKAKIAQGDVIARPIPLLNSICRRIETERKAPSVSAQKPSAMRAYLESQKANRQQESVP